MRRRKLSRLWLVLGTAAAIIAALPTPASAAIVVTGQVTTNDPNSVGRAAQAPNAASTSSCGVVPATVTTAGSYNYDAYVFQNTSATTSCVTVAVSHPCNAEFEGLFVAAYLTNFNAASPTENLIGRGFTQCDSPHSFSFLVPAGEFFTVVAWENFEGDGTEPYTLTIDGAGVVRIGLAATFRSIAAARTSKGVMVRWSTASESQMLGFHVYRQVNGKRVRVNRTLIAAKGRGGYSFLDRKAPRGAKGLRYWLQVVNLDGSRTWYGPARVLRTYSSRHRALTAGGTAQARSTPAFRSTTGFSGAER